MYAVIGDVRGRGVMLGVELVTDHELKTPAKLETLHVMDQMKEIGVLVGKGGSYGNVFRITPEDAGELLHISDVIPTLHFLCNISISCYGLHHVQDVMLPVPWGANQNFYYYCAVTVLCYAPPSSPPPPSYRVSIPPPFFPLVSELDCLSFIWRISMRRLFSGFVD
ncbi:hypothetical protein V6N13_099904 [Hibiscus sabdariffa]